ncbi:MAG TPA: hypothetical protein VLD67_14015 [Vicinamibacterales bacterium]|nr:hypothetical protein [Vicinamibacterales bacterium]
MSDSRIRVWFALFVLAVFCIGLASGVLIGRRLLPDGPGRGFVRGSGPPGGRGPGGGPPPDALLQRLTRDLDLDSDQHAKLEAVLEASRDRVRGLQKDVRGRFDAEQQRLRSEIRELLTPDQQQRFDRWADRPPRGRGSGRGRPASPRGDR